MNVLARETAEALGFVKGTREHAEAEVIIEAALIRARRDETPRENEVKALLDQQRESIACLVHGNFGVPGRAHMAELIRRGADRSQ